MCGTSCATGVFEWEEVWPLWRLKEFHNLVLYRNRSHPLRRRLIALFYPPMDALYMDASEIGGCLFIQHGFVTTIAAKFIGVGSISR